jgi:DnaK suppressor protein
MDTEHFRKRLLEKERELLADISRVESAAREARSAEVEDPIDQVTSSEIKAVGFTEGTLAAQTLAQVRQALQRLNDGTYGTCIECGRSIEPARLNAVPWSAYCRDDQEKQDKAALEGLDDNAALRS